MNTPDLIWIYTKTGLSSQPGAKQCIHRRKGFTSCGENRYALSLAHSKCEPEPASSSVRPQPGARRPGV